VRTPRIALALAAVAAAVATRASGARAHPGKPFAVHEWGLRAIGYIDPLPA
jgi:hypothetical protein